jgi:hypothetical protein
LVCCDDFSAAAKTLASRHRKCMRENNVIARKIPLPRVTKSSRDLDAGEGSAYFNVATSAYHLSEHNFN